MNEGKMEEMELTLDELQERWEMLYWHCGIEKLKITEQTINYNDTSYVVSGLNMEFEDECVMCDDVKHVIRNKSTMLTMFLKKQCEKILLLPTDTITGYKEYIIFSNGDVAMIECV